jgi:hypothetical protein
MRLPIALVAGFAAALAVAQSAAAAPPSIEIKDAAARVVVIPENRADVRVEITSRNPRLPLTVRTLGARTVIAGDLRGSRIRDCPGVGEGAAVRIAALGEIPYADLPQIVVHAPVDVTVTAGGAVFGSIGRARNVDLGNAGCGDWVIGNVDQQLRISVAAEGEVRTGSAGEAKLRVAGSGDIATGEVRGRVDVDVAGAGGVRVKSVAGALDVHVAGSGDVNVLGGHASAMTASVAGSGNIVFGGVADSLEARIAGAGDVRARQVRGRIKKSVMGPGAVRIG